VPLKDYDTIALNFGDVKLRRIIITKGPRYIDKRDLPNPGKDWEWIICNTAHSRRMYFITLSKSENAMGWEEYIFIFSYF